MNREFEGFSKIFSFTFKQHIKGSAYKKTLVIVLLLCFLLPAVIMPASELMSGDEDTASQTDYFEISDLYIADLTDSGSDWSFLSGIFGAAGVHNYNNTEAAFADAEMRGGQSLVLTADVSEDGKYSFNVLVPENSELDIHSADMFSKFIECCASYIIMQISDISAEITPELVAPVYTGSKTEGATENEAGVPIEEVREVFSAVLPYITILLLYFMILFYGQGVANSVIMEKTSKLMDMFLVSVKTGAMLLGKVVAISLAGIIELTLWICGAVGGFAVGTLIVKAINPDTSMGIIKFFDSLELFRGMFSLSSVLLAVAVLVAGFFVYCSLASIGGAIAGKPEDLSSTNVLFTMALVVSFLLTLNFGGSDGMISTYGWIEWFPFTAILVMPGKIMLGEVGMLQIAALIAILAATAVLIIYIAGRVYKMMSLYKGKVPKIGEVIKMVFNKN